jgi:hypothetical protein
LEKKEKDLETWKCRLAEHFCEDLTTFKIEDCFNILFRFCEKMKAIIQVSFFHSSFICVINLIFKIKFIFLGKSRETLL